MTGFRLWFLRLFAAFRTLESQYAALNRQFSGLVSEIECLQPWKHRAVAAEKELNSFRETTQRGISDLHEKLSLANAETNQVREAYNAEVQDHIRTRDRLEAALEERAKLWDMVDKSLAGERSALRMEINHLVQRSGGSPPYPEEHTLDESRLAKPQAPGPAGRAARELPSQRAARAMRESLELIAEDMPTKSA